jgi:hypothetical protein
MRIDPRTRRSRVDRNGLRKQLSEQRCRHIKPL